MNPFTSKRYLPLRKLLSFVLIFALIFTLIPSSSTEAAKAAKPKKQELTDQRTETTKLFDNGDGTFSKQIYPTPVHHKKGDQWVDISAKLIGASDANFVTTENTDIGVRFLTQMKKGEYAAFENGPHSLTYSFLGAAGVTAKDVPAVYEDNRIFYKDVLPGIDLRNIALDSSVKEDLILNRYSGVSTFLFHINTQLDAKLADNGEVIFADKNGTAVFTLPKPFMTDSNIDEKSGDAQRSDNVSFQLEKQGNGWLLKLVADPNWLQDSARVYPVYIDPTTAKATQGNDAYVSSQWPTTNYNGDWDSTYGFYGLKTGYYPGAGENFSYVKMLVPTSPDLRNYTIESATLNLYTGHSYSTTATGVWADTVSANWAPETITWNNKPASTALTSTTTVKGQWASFNVTTVIRNMVSNNLTNNYGFKLHTNGNNETYWKKFYAIENQSNKPYLNITYTTKTPSAPTATAYANWTGSESSFLDLKWEPVPGATGYKVWIFNGKDYEAFDVKNVTAWSTHNQDIWPTEAEIAGGRYLLHHDANGAELAKDPRQVYTNSGGSTTWGYYGDSTRYYVRVSAYSSYGESPMSAGTSLTMPERAEDLGHEEFWPYAAVPGGDINTATGNLILSGEGFSLPGLGPDVDMNRTYNSRSPEDGAFGFGWTFPYEMRLSTDASGDVIFKDADGTTHLFKKNTDGSFQRPLGVYLDLVKDAGYSLTNRDQVKFTFDAGGKLTKIQDDNNNALTLAYNAASQLVSLTDATVRVTQITYDAASGNIASVTDPANRVWRYAYDGANLKTVTNPKGYVTEFTYTDNKLTATKAYDPANSADLPTLYAFTYDADGRLTAVQDPGSQMTTIAYDPANQKTTVTNNKGVSAVYTYNVSGNPESEVTDSAGLKLTSTYKYDHNNLTEVKDPNTNQLQTSTGTAQQPNKSFTFDANGNMLTATDVIKGKETYTYNKNNDVVSFTDRKGNKYTNTFDGKNLTSTTNPAKVSEGKLYDASGNGNIVASTEKMGMAENLFANSGLEETVPDLSQNYVKLTGNNNGTIGFETKPALTGSAIKVVSTPVDSGWGYIAATKEIAVQPNTTYLLKGKIKTSNVTNGGAFLNVYQMDANGAGTAGYTDSRATRVSGSTDWVDQQVQVTTSATTTKLRVYLELEHSGILTSGTAWFDTMHLINVTSGTAPANWTKTTLNDNGIVSSTGDAARQGYQAVKLMPKSASSNFGYVAATQDVAVKPNTTYTLSGLIKTDNLTGANAFLNTMQLKADGMATANPYADNRYSQLNGTQDWTERQLSFTTSADAVKVRVFLEVDHSTTATSGAAYFDNLQLEPSAVSTRFNPLQNTSFEGGITDWANYSAGQIDSAESFDGTKSLKFVRSSTTAAYGMVMQRIPLNQTTAAPVTISGMSKAENVNNAVEKGQSKDYSIWIDAGHGDDTYTVGQAMFSLGTHDWQRSAVTLNPNRPIKYLNVYLLFRNNNAGTVWFDNIRVQEGSAITTYGYDAKGNYVTKLTNPSGQVTQSSYDLAGNLAQQTDSGGLTRTFGYDELNRPLTTTIDDANIRLANTYDKQGNVIEKKLTSADGSTVYNKISYSFNAAGQTTSATDPLGNTVAYEYDTTGNLTKILNPTGNTHEQLYDAAGRVTEVKFNGVPYFRHTYDANSNNTKTENLLLGETKTRTYDKANRLTALNGPEGTLSYRYDANDNTTSRTIVNGGKSYALNYTYNNLDQNTLVQDAMTSRTYRFDYDEMGKPRSLINGNGVGTMIAYDDNQQIESLLIGKSGGVSIGQFRYEYDENGNRTKIIDGSGKQVTAYTYDKLNQLTSEIDRVTGNKIEYTYDAVGNRQRKVVTNTAGTVLSTTNYSHNAMNQLTAVNGQPLNYDKIGSLLEDGEKLYTWDASGRLSKLVNKTDGSAAQYFYDEEGRRIRTVKAGVETNYVYKGQQVQYETNAAGAITRYYTYSANGQLLSTTKVEGAVYTTYYYHLNERGDVIAVTDDSNNYVAQYTYDAWGNIVAQSGSFADENPYRYGSYRYDVESGLYYLTARYYNPQYGTFLSLDPQAGEMTDPLTHNGYLYGANNPVSFIDPDGEFFFLAVFAIPAIVEAVAAMIYFTALTAAVIWTATNPVKVPTLHSSSTDATASGSQTGGSAKAKERVQNKPAHGPKPLPGTKNLPRVEVPTKGWQDVGDMDTHLEQEGLTQSGEVEETGDMFKEKVLNPDGTVWGEIHYNQPHYDPETGEPTGKYYPDHMQRYKPSKPGSFGKGHRYWND
ncbi:DNRLRE domain-containing protein [Tumebacillus avium]|uniref:DNRLRE domain-containing protein n=1 Tax=Tumebacillus avium TaxID=1903704 RepID=UPI0018E04979|nr:DNRLRE domain-containing protein [Tumebacillus avium]